MDAAGLAWLFPAGTVFQPIDASENEEEDRRTIDRYLKDRGDRNAATPAFDFVALNATHLPYAFPAEHAIFQPAPKLTSSHHILRSSEDLEIVRNRYRNGCHFADEQIGRILDDLETQGDFSKTIVVVTGDHGEEFQERGQLTHAGVLNDYQARTVLWMHLPDAPPEPLAIDVPTVHMDIVPTLLNALGFDEDVLYTRSLAPTVHTCDIEPASLSRLADTYVTLRLHAGALRFSRHSGDVGNSARCFSRRLSSKR